VQKRLHHDVGHLIDAMRAGFNIVSQKPQRQCCSINNVNVAFIQPHACDFGIPNRLRVQIQPDDATLRSMDVTQLQHKLFPLHPLTLADFKSRSRCLAPSNLSKILERNERLFWSVMAEDMSEEQVCASALHVVPLPHPPSPSPPQVRNVFYFTTNFHTLEGSDRKVSIVFQSREDGDMLPKASTCRSSNTRRTHTNKQDFCSACSVF
jgi:hypothetical protein